MKKWLIVLFMFTCAIACVFGLAGCGEKPDDGNENQGTTQAPSDENNATGEEKPHTHALTLVDAKPAECETSGNTAYYTCSCGKWFSDLNATSEITVKGSVNIEAIGHSYSDEWISNETQHWHKATCAHATLTSAAQNHTFENNICTICKYNNDLISFKSLEVKGDTAYGKVSNATADFSFIKEVTVNGGATFTVATDKACREVVPSKTVDLQEGDNVFYILAERGEIIKLFTVILRRRPIYTVTFDTTGGSEVEEQAVEEGGFAQIQQTSRAGYTFANWDYDFSQPILKNETATASWTANSYTVTLDVNGGEALTENFQQVTYDQIFTLPTANKTWYIFLGWYYGETQITDTSGDSIVNWNIAEDITLNCEWETIFTIRNDEITGLKEFAKSFKEIEILPIIDGIEIKSIATEAFKDCVNLQKITIPESVTNIGEGAFNGCNNLQQMKLPFYEKYSYGYDNVFGSLFGYTVVTTTSPYIYDTAYIREGATQQYWTNEPYGSNRLYTYYYYYIPESLQSVIITGSCVPFRAFANCKFDISILEGVNYIGNEAFRGCTSLKSIEIPKGVSRIGSWAFKGCTSLESIAIPNSITIIGSWAFEGCTSLKSIVIPYGVKTIGDEAFNGCSELTTIVIADSVTYIGNNAFYNTKYYKDYSGNNWDDGVLYIGNHLIKARVSLSGSYKIRDGVVTIANDAFNGCDLLESINIPDSVVSVGAYAFKGCSSLTIYCEAISESIGWDKYWNYSNRPVVWDYKNDIG